MSGSRLCLSLGCVWEEAVSRRRLCLGVDCVWKWVVTGTIPFSHLFSTHSGIQRPPKYLQNILDLIGEDAEIRDVNKRDKT